MYVQILFLMKIVDLRRGNMVIDIHYVINKKNRYRRELDLNDKYLKSFLTESTVYSIENYYN